MKLSKSNAALIAALSVAGLFAGASAANAVGDNSWSDSRSCSPGLQVRFSVHTGGATDVFWNQIPLPNGGYIYHRSSAGPMDTYFDTGLRHITGTVYVTAGYVYADRTWMGCS